MENRETLKLFFPAVSMVLVRIAACAAPVVFDSVDMRGLQPVNDLDGMPQIAALSLKICPEELGARIFKPLHPYSANRGAAGLTYRHSGCYDLGVAAAAGVEPGPDDIESHWTGSAVEWRRGEGRALRILASRLTPAVLFECEGPEPALRVFGGPPVGRWTSRQETVKAETTVPKYFAVPLKDGVRVFTVETLSELAPEQVVAPWMLAWYGNANSYPSGFERGGQWRSHLFPTVDCPVLLVFGQGWNKVALLDNGNGVEFGFSGDAARIAMLPLLGERHPLAEPATPMSEWKIEPHALRTVHEASARRIGLDPDIPPTETWAEGPPAGILEKCGWWSERLAAFPWKVVESYEAGNDAVTIRCKMEYIRLRAGGTLFAPLPPFVAMSRTMGFPVETAAVSDPGFMSPYGPYLGFDADEAVYNVKGLSRYIEPAARNGAEQLEPAELRETFLSEMDKALEAGVMAPWLAVVSTGPATWGVRAYAKDRGRQEFGNPGENLYFICEYLDLLDQPRRDKALQLMREWHEAFPPEAVAHMPSMSGARRERYPVDAGEYSRSGQEFPMADVNFHLIYNILPVESMYFLARYHAALNEPPAEFPGHITGPYIHNLDWACGGFFAWVKNYTADKRGWVRHHDVYYGWGGAADINRYFAGMLGHARLAGTMNDEQERALGAYLFAKAALTRFALEKFTEYLYRDGILAPYPDQQWLRIERGRGLHTFRRLGPADDPLTVAAMSEFGVYMHEVEPHLWQGGRLMPYYGIVPELGLFLRDRARQRGIDYANIVERCMPDWYTIMARAPIAGEQETLYPTDSHQVFMLRAWLAGDEPDRLWTYADLSWLERGDWYYMHKLAETIRAYRAGGGE